MGARERFITGTGGGEYSSSGSVNLELAYQRRAGLDPDTRADIQFGKWGVQAVLTDLTIWFMIRAGTGVRPDWVEPVADYTRVGSQLRYEKVGLPGMRNQLFHFDFPDGTWFVGSASLMRVVRSEVNDPRTFIAAWGPDAVDLGSGGDG